MVKKTIIPATKKTGKELLKDNSKVLRVCAYVRVSTDTEEQLESFNAQIGRYKRIICEDHKDDWEFAGIFADTESGTTIEKREEFQDMMDKCRAGLIDLILVKQMSRFGRNTINTLQAIYELRSLGVEIWFENDDIFGSNPRLDFMLTMLSGLAQEEARQQSLRVSSGIRERMESGNIAKRIKPIFGFRKDITDTIYVYEPEAILVRIVFLLYASGIKTHDIAEIAARDFPKDYTNGLSRPHLYDGYLLNTRYKGTVVLQKTFKPNYISKQVKRNKGERPMYIYENYHKAIIPPSFYEYANSRRGNKTFEIVNDSFSSFLYCGLCTRNLKPVKKCGRRKGESYYSCNVYQDHHIIYCDLKYQDGKVLEDIVDDILGQLADIETLIDRVKSQLLRILSNAIGNKKKYDILKTANEITTLKSKLKSNEALMIANPDIINDEKFKTNIETTKLNINKLGRELKAIKNTDYLIDKKDKCLNQLDALLSKRMIYALLAKAINLKVIVLPNYKIILVLNKSNLDEASFRKQIHQFVEKAESSLFIDSIKIRQNGMPVNYSFTMTKI